VNRREALSCLCILIGYSLFGIYGASLRLHFYFPLEVYWLSFVFVIIPLLYEVFYWKNNPKLRLLCLLSLSLMVNLQYAVVDSSSFLSSEDAVADYKLTYNIIATSKWTTPNVVNYYFGYEYVFYPITNFIYATMSLMTGIPLLFVIKYLFIIKALIVAPLSERFFRIFFNKRVAYLAAALFLMSPGAIIFPHKESFGVIFFFLGIYAIIKSEKLRQFALIGYISIATLVMTHHFSSYVFLGFLVALYFSSLFHNRQKGVVANPRHIGNYLLFSFVAFTAWVAYISYTIVAFHERNIADMFLSFLSRASSTSLEVFPSYTIYEKIITTTGLAIVAVSTVIGFLIYVRNKKIFSFNFFVPSVFLLMLVVVGSFLRFSPHVENVVISHRVLEFGYLAIGAFSAIFFFWVLKSRTKLSSNVIVIGVIVIMMITGPMLGAMHPRNMQITSDVVSLKGLSVTAWMSESNATFEYTVGDHLVYFILSIYGDSKVAQYPEFYVDQNFALPPEVRQTWSYVVTYVYMTNIYGLNSTRFTGSPNFQCLYSNGMLNVYGVTNRTSS